MLTRSQWEKEEAQGRERKLQEEMALHREKLADGQEAFRKACESALEARVRHGQEAAGGKPLEHMHASQQVTLLPFLCRYSVGHSLVVQGLRLLTSMAKSWGSIPGWETEIPQAAWHGHKKKVFVILILP